jgi:transcriptional regulator with XRE-family HTH domain
LGAELRKLRERAGLTARQAGELLGTGPVQISHIEVGRIGVSEERLRRLASHYRCTDRKLVDALVVMATERSRGWWEEHRGTMSTRLLDLAELEHRADRLRSVQVVHIPGILQTEDYARAIHTYGHPHATPGHLDDLVRFRLRRREALLGNPATSVTAIIHEAALRIRVGDRTILREQLEFLLAAAEHPGVTVRIVPFDAEGFAGMGYSMLYADGPVPQLDTVQLDTAHGSVLLDAEAQLNAYRELYDKAESMSLPVEPSADLVRSLAAELQAAS